MFTLDFLNLAYVELFFSLSNFPSLLPHGFIFMADRGKDKSLQLSIAASVPSSQQADACLPQQYRQTGGQFKTLAVPKSKVKGIRKYEAKRLQGDQNVLHQQCSALYNPALYSGESDHLSPLLPQTSIDS